MVWLADWFGCGLSGFVVWLYSVLHRIWLVLVALLCVCYGSWIFGGFVFSDSLI